MWAFEPLWVFPNFSVENSLLTLIPTAAPPTFLKQTFWVEKDPAKLRKKS